MATPVDGSPAEVSPEIVGNAFVTQFYCILHESPEMVHRFFQDASTMTRPGPDGTLNTVTTMKEINDVILSLNCKDYKAEILTADAQASHKGGVVVLVTGCLTGKDNVRRKFTESFFLAPQDNGYFVLNDAFRFVEEDSLPLVNPVVEKEIDTNAPQAPLTPSQETVEVPVNQIAAPEIVAENKIEAVDVPRAEQKASVIEATISQAHIESICDTQPLVETSSNGHVDAPKKSYASLLKNMKEMAAKSQVHVPSPVAKKTATPNSTQPPVASAIPQSRPDTVPATASGSHAVNGTNTNGSSTHTTEDKGHSIYIGDLPWNATDELVEQEFKKFGRIKQKGIQVRSNKGYCFGFVEYEDASAKQKAIEMGTIEIHGKEVFIQEKKTTTRVVNGVSMYPSGRGGGYRNDGYRNDGYRNDGFRGRDNYSNGRGYPRNDYKRNGDVPPRSSRNGDGYVQQNGGGGGGGRSGARQVAAVK